MHVRAQLGGAGPDGRLDHLGHHPHRGVEVVRAGGDPQRGSAAFLVAAEAVVEDRRGRIEHGESDASPRAVTSARVRPMR